MKFNFSLYLAVITAIVVMRSMAPTPGSVATQLSNMAPNIVTQPYNDVIRVDISDRKLCYRGTCYPVSVGSPATPTPLGRYTITAVDARSEGYTLPVLSFLRMQNPQTKEWGYAAVHETDSLDKPTQGCIAMLPQHLTKLLQQYPYYAQIEILY